METDKLNEFRQSFRTWLSSNVPQGFLADRTDYAAPSIEDVRLWERALYQAGFAALTIPVAYGGRGLSFDEHLVVSEEMGRLALPESVNSIGKEIISTILLALGSEEQKRRYLPGIFNMDDIWCQGFSEPQAGSDLAAVRTKAVRKDGGWSISGSKIWTSYADRAAYCLLLTRTGDPADRYNSLSLFIVPLKSPGIDIRPIAQLDGSKEFCEVFFDNVRLDSSALVGEVDKGWSGAVSVLSVERATNRMYRGWRFENEIRHLKSVCDSQPVLRDAAIGLGVDKSIRALATDARVVQLYAKRIVGMIRDGVSPGAIGSLMKLHWSEAHVRLASLAQRLLAAVAGDETPEIARLRARFEDIYLRARSETLIAGTSEVQASIIADRIMQLPKGGRRP